MQYSSKQLSVTGAQINVCGQTLDRETLNQLLVEAVGIDAFTLNTFENNSEFIESNQESELPTVAVNLSLSKTAEALNRSPFYFSIAVQEEQSADLYLHKTFTLKQLVSAIVTGLKVVQSNRHVFRLTKEVAIATREREELGKVGTALSAEKDLDKLLTLVLEEGRSLGNCEAASLYLLVDEKSEKPCLLFKLTQNSEINFDSFKENRFPLTNRSLAGYVALTGEILNIRDAYELSDDLPYKFDKSFDLTTRYRTRELLVLPMRNHQGKIIGVLQFINNRENKNQLNASPQINLSQENLGFSRERESLLLSLASQAAVAIDNSQLIENIQQLFEGFVSASVKAIESRDPVTSGHSFRVAELTTGLAEVLDAHNSGKYGGLRFSNSQMREIRYASLLHDFGKVGVKESVLLKPNKLHDNRLNYLLLKLEWQKQLLQRRYFQSLVVENNQTKLQSWQQDISFNQLQSKLKELDEFRLILETANRPSLLEEEIVAELKNLFEYKMDPTYPFNNSLLSQEDFLSLSVKKGSLTEQERIEIQSHVIHTEMFLSEIPWTEELSFIPQIAASHHEKLDGTGYPKGMSENEIPVASRIMAIADIYDALTARDRPYKKAVATDLALDILQQEANHGKLCRDMVSTFIESKVYQKISSN